MVGSVDGLTVTSVTFVSLTLTEPRLGRVGERSYVFRVSGNVFCFLIEW